MPQHNRPYALGCCCHTIPYHMHRGQTTLNHLHKDAAATPSHTAPYHIHRDSAAMSHHTTCTGTLLSHNAYGQNNKVPQEAVPEEVARKVRRVALALNCAQHATLLERCRFPRFGLLVQPVSALQGSWAKHTVGTCFCWPVLLTTGWLLVMSVWAGAARLHPAALTACMARAAHAAVATGHDWGSTFVMGTRGLKLCYVTRNGLYCGLSE